MFALKLDLHNLKFVNAFQGLNEESRKKTVQVSNFENRSEPLAAITTTPGTVPELPTHCPLT